MTISTYVSVNPRTCGEQDSDMQLLFIKSLSSVLIRRMHSMDRFSKDESAVGGDSLKAWDIVYDKGAKHFGVIINLDDNILSAFFLKNHCEITGVGSTVNFHQNSLLSRATRTITESENVVFLEALEACYA